MYIATIAKTRTTAEKHHVEGEDGTKTREIRFVNKNKEIMRCHHRPAHVPRWSVWAFAIAECAGA